MMVKSFFIVAALVASAAAIPFKRTVPQVESDIASISSQVSALDTAIKGFPNTGGSLIQALAIHSDAQNLISTLSTATRDVQATTNVGESDAQTILASVQAFEPTIIDALSTIAGKKAAFSSLPIGGIPALVLSDLQDLDDGTTAFENALISETPADLRSQADSIKSAIDAAFANAIAAFS